MTRGLNNETRSHDLRTENNCKARYCIDRPVQGTGHRTIMSLKLVESAKCLLFGCQDLHLCFVFFFAMIILVDVEVVHHLEQIRILVH